MRQQDELKSLTLLGEHKTTYPTDYAPEMLETFENKHPENEYLVTLNCPEFTSLCPKTGQPDFAKIVISYIPRTFAHHCIGLLFNERFADIDSKCVP